MHSIPEALIFWTRPSECESKICIKYSKHGSSFLLCLAYFDPKSTVCKAKINLFLTLILYFFCPWKKSKKQQEKSRIFYQNFRNFQCCPNLPNLPNLPKQMKTQIAYSMFPILDIFDVNNVDDAKISSAWTQIALKK